MKQLIANMFSNEQEYYQMMLENVRGLLAGYIKTHLNVSDAGALRHNGGIVMFQDELLELLKDSSDHQTRGDFRTAFKETFQSIRECGIRTIRSGNIIVLEYLFRQFGLDEFEAYLVTLSLCSELDHKLQIIFSNLTDHIDAFVPTVNLAISMYAENELEQRRLQKQCMNRWNVLGFLFSGFYEISGEAKTDIRFGYLEQKLKLDYRILEYLQNFESLDESLAGIVKYGDQRVKSQNLLIHQNIAEGMDRLAKSAEGSVNFFLSGEYGAGKKMQVLKFCERHKLSVLLVDSKRLPENSREQRALLRRIVREAILQGNAAICIYDLESEYEDEKVSCEKVEDLLWGLDFWHGTLILTSQYSWNRRIQDNGRNICRFKIPETTTEDRIILWKAMLLEEMVPEDLQLEFLADKYVLSAGCIKNCITEYENRLKMEGAAASSKWLLEACRNQIDHKLGKDAIRIRAQYEWDDLVLPELQKKMLQDACDQVLLQHQVYRRWGFEEKVAYGKGVSMIFYGPPGTGKTMGAQVIANMLKLELYKVDMAGVMSKYVGESEKKLGNIFEQAKKSQSILFFDEADVLFGKRTDQKDSNDKYSNASTAYLLQKIEEYEGIIILATNLLQNFDNAFLRRFKFIIEFPFTDEKRRKEIWQKVFPAGMPKEEIDVDYLAEEFKFSGSQIKNVAVAASFLAAGEKVPLGMKQILIAVKREMAKTGKTLIASDFGPYYYLMEGQEG